MLKMKHKLILPRSIRDFVERQQTVPIERLIEDSGTPSYPYCEYWRRAVAAMLLSGRVAAKDNGFPNMADVNRICKEANFDQYLFEQTGRFLVTAKIIQPNERSSRYEAAQFSDSFWNHRLEPLQEATRRAFLDFVQQFTPSRERRSTQAVNSKLDWLVALFAAVFAGLAIPRDQAGHVFLDFSQLPAPDLVCLGHQMGLQISQWDVDGWNRWLDQPGQQALLSALFVSSWVYAADYRKQCWIYLSDTGLIILGLVAPPELPAPIVDLMVLPNLCVFAGADLPPEKLVPLFRHCKIKRIDRVFEFQLDKRQLTETVSHEPSGWNLRAVLEESGPLPATVDSLLRNRPLERGEIRIRRCSAIVQPESAEVLDAIRQHSRLKGYLEAEAPKGYLLIKQLSNSNNFVQRCEELGFKVTILQG
jgi:hypothetical protein